MTKQLSGGKDKMDKKWETAQKEKTLREGLTSMLCFQMALCLAAVGVFFASVRLGGENEDAARNAARLLCQEQPLSVDTEIWSSFGSSFVGFGREERVIFWRKFGILSRNRLFRPSSCPSRWLV